MFVPRTVTLMGPGSLKITSGFCKSPRGTMLFGPSGMIPPDSADPATIREKRGWWFDNRDGAKYAGSMSVVAMQLLEQFRKLPPSERREVCEVILRESVQLDSAAGRKTIAAIAGKYRPEPDAGAKWHDREFAEAALASKRSADEP
jgi:hypothetical protein